MARGNPNPSPATRFQKGHVANPNGISKARAELEHKVKATKAELKDLFLKCLSMTSEQIDAFLDRPDATMFELVYGRLVRQAADGRDHFAVSFVTDRLFGHLRDNINVTENKTVVYKTTISPDGIISCNAIDVEADTEVAMKSLEAYGTADTDTTTGTT